MIHKGDFHHLCSYFESHDAFSLHLFGLKRLKTFIYEGSCFYSASPK